MEHRKNASNNRLFSYDDFVLYEEDAHSLQVRGWLTDNMVNFAVSYIGNQIFGGEQQSRVAIVYATQCELLKFEEGDAHTMLLQNIGVSPELWTIFIYNNSDQPDIVYSGTHWSLILFDPNQHRLWLIDPLNASFMSGQHPNDAQYDNQMDPAINNFAAKMRNFLHVTTQQEIYKYPRNPPMEIAGDCGIFVIEYARVILRSISANVHADPELDFDFHTFGDHILHARQKWQQIVDSLTQYETIKNTHM